jgi:hypothetical protein
VNSDLPNRLLEQGDLAADGLHGQAQALGRARDAALLGDHPEIVQVAKIGAGVFHLFRFYEVMLRLSSLFQ